MTALTIDCYSDPPIPTGCFYYLGKTGFCETFEGIGYARIFYTFRGRPGLFAPVNTFSNIFYCMAAFYIYKKVFPPYLKELREFLRFWPLITILVFLVFLQGIFSAFYHGSMWHGCQILDQYGMNMILLLLTLMTGSTQIEYNGKKNLLYFFFAVLYQFYLVLTIALPFNDEGDLEFQGRTIQTQLPSFKFLILLIFLFFFDCQLWYLSRIPILNTSEYTLLEPKSIYKENVTSLLWRLIFSLGIGFLMSRIDEMYCTKVTVYFLPLLWWHMLSAYGIVIQCALIRCSIYQNCKSQEFLLKYKYYLFPQYIKINE